MLCGCEAATVSGERRKRRVMQRGGPDDVRELNIARRAQLEQRARPWYRCARRVVSTRVVRLEREWRGRKRSAIADTTGDARAGHDARSERANELGPKRREQYCAAACLAR